MWNSVLEMLGRYRTAAISGLVVMAVLVGVLVIPRGGTDSDDLVRGDDPQATETIDGEPIDPDDPPEGTIDPVTGLPTVPGRTTPTGPGGTTGSPTAGPAATGPIGPTRGVTPNKIRIGVAIPDLEAFARVNANWDVGDTQEMMDSILDGWRRDGLVPVNGRDIEFVYRKFDIFGSEPKIAACRAFVEQDKVFSVIALRFFGEGVECVTERFKTPAIGILGERSGVYQRTAPYFFTLRPPLERMLRNWIHWAHTEGHLKGKTLGLFYDDEAEEAVEVAVRRELTRWGYTIAREVKAESAGIGSQQDQLAVQQFRSADVDLVLPVVGGTSMMNFTTFAESQGWRPAYIDSDYAEHATDAAASAYPPSQWDGTPAVTSTRVGELSSGMGMARPTKTCIDHYERFSGNQVRKTAPETAEFNNLVLSCDAANTMLRGIRLAGSGLGHLSLIRGMRNIEGLALAGHGNLSFSADRHYGLPVQRTIRWARSCACWRASGPFRQYARP